MKILHTADIHLDWKFSGVQDTKKRQRRRQEHRDVYRQIVDVGLEKDVDVVLIVGDLFEQKGFSLDTIRFIQRELNRLKPTPVFISPGNHDPFIQRSPYLLDGWDEHIHIFHESRFTSYSLDDYDATIYGIAHTAYQDKKKYLQEFTVEDTKQLNIVLLHGSYTNVIPEAHREEPYFSFTQKDLFDCKADYIALGHYHGCRFIPEDNPIAAYPGTPEGMGFSELGERYILIGEITKNGNQIKKVCVNQREYRSLELDCSDFVTRESALDEIRQRIKSQGLSEHILRIKFTGTVSPDIDLNLPLMQEKVNEFCFQAILINQTTPRWDVETLKKQPNIRGEFVRKLSEMIQKSEDEDKELYQLALNYGLEALSKRQEVTLR